VKDLALLFVPDLKVPALHIAAAEPARFSKVYVMGAPHGFQYSTSEGFLVDKQDYEGMWRISGAFMMGGLSGGTITDLHGDLICVPRRGVLLIAHLKKDSDNGPEALGSLTIPLPQVGYCVPLQTIKAFLEGYTL
jgi:hypothetical protein